MIKSVKFVSKSNYIDALVKSLSARLSEMIYNFHSSRQEMFSFSSLILTNKSFKSQFILFPGSAHFLQFLNLTCF